MSEVKAFVDEEGLPVFVRVDFRAVAEEIDALALAFDIAGAMQREDGEEVFSVILGDPVHAMHGRFVVKLMSFTRLEAIWL